MGHTMSITKRCCFLFLLTVLASAYALRLDSLTMAPIDSYHMHVVYDDKRAVQNASAITMRENLKARFGIGDCNPDLNTTIADEGQMCTQVYTGEAWGPHSSPFPVAQWAVFVPLVNFTEVMWWMNENRGRLDVLFHPQRCGMVNGCGMPYAGVDHLVYSMWAGNKWKLAMESDFEDFFCDGWGCTVKNATNLADSYKPMLPFGHSI